MKLLIFPIIVNLRQAISLIILSFNIAESLPSHILYFWHRCSVSSLSIVIQTVQDWSYFADIYLTNFCFQSKNFKFNYHMWLCTYIWQVLITVYLYHINHIQAWQADQLQMTNTLAYRRKLPEDKGYRNKWRYQVQSQEWIWVVKTSTDLVI